jgi:hypothetical protein
VSSSHYHPQKRRRQAFQARVAQLNDHQIVWMDECGVDQGVYWRHGRSTRGIPVDADIEDKRYASRSRVMAAYQQGHLLAPLRFEGSTDTGVFNTWVRHCLVPILCPGQVVMMDNARFHLSPPTRNLIEQAPCLLLSLPTYSPDLNKFEHPWAILKRGIRAQANTPIYPFLTNSIINSS